MIDWTTIFRYSDGNLYWLIKTGKVKPGDKAGWTNSNGYNIFCYKGKYYSSSRVIWELLKGPIPHDFEIDHIDRNRSNDLITNLRLATKSSNLANRDSAGTLKLRGISWSKSNKKYRVDVSNKTQRIIVYCSSVEAAKAAYNKEAKLLHGEFAFQHK